MKRALNPVTTEQRDRIAAAVAEAESKTSAEIVPVVAAISGRYDRAEDMVGLLAGLIFLAVAWAIFPRVPVEPGSWATTVNVYELPALMAAVVAGFMFGLPLAMRFPRLHRFFIPRTEVRQEVMGRAQRVFFDSRVYRTAAGTGVLLYVSLYERTAVVLAGDAVMEKLGQQAVDGVCAQLVSAMRVGDPAGALCAVLKDLGERLGAVLPRPEGDVNELANRPVIMN
jgi:putative membrane protein